MNKKDKDRYRIAVIYGMIILMVVLFTLPFLMVFASRDALAAGDASACYNIADSDRRSMCLAKAHGDRSICYSVKAAEIRAQCLAEVRTK